MAMALAQGVVAKHDLDALVRLWTLRRRDARRLLDAASTSAFEDGDDRPQQQEKKHSLLAALQDLSERTHLRETWRSMREEAILTSMETSPVFTPRAATAHINRCFDVSTKWPLLPAASSSRLQKHGSSGQQHHEACCSADDIFAVQLQKERIRPNRPYPSQSREDLALSLADHQHYVRRIVLKALVHSSSNDLLLNAFMTLLDTAEHSRRKFVQAWHPLWERVNRHGAIQPLMARGSSEGSSSRRPGSGCSSAEQASQTRHKKGVVQHDEGCHDSAYAIHNSTLQDLRRSHASRIIQLWRKRVICRRVEMQRCARHKVCTLQAVVRSVLAVQQRRDAMLHRLTRHNQALRLQSWWRWRLKWKRCETAWLENRRHDDVLSLMTAKGTLEAVLAIQRAVRYWRSKRIAWWKRRFRAHRYARRSQREWFARRNGLLAIAPMEEHLVLSALCTSKELAHIESEKLREASRCAEQFARWKRHISRYFLTKKTVPDTWAKTSLADATTSSIGTSKPGHVGLEDEDSWGGTVLWRNVQTGRIQMDHPHLKTLHKEIVAEQKRAVGLLGEQFDELDKYKALLTDAAQYLQAQKKREAVLAVAACLLSAQP